MNKSDKYKTICGHYDEEWQITVCIEEMAELTKAFCKYRRKKSPEAVADIKEEIADVLNMAHQMAVVFGADEIDKICDQKLDRTIQRIRDKG